MVFSLEDWTVCSDGFSIVATVVSNSGSGDFSLLSLLGKQKLGAHFVDGAPLVGEEVTLLNFALTQEGGSYCANQTDESIWFPRASSCLEGVYKIRELCAGLGAMGTGASSLGFCILSALELQQATCEAFTRNCEAPVIRGDVTCPKTIGQLWLQAPGPAGVCCGFSCQPFSAFGDQRAQRDARSGSLPGALKAALWLQAPFVLLECVCPAGDNAWVQGVLDSFCRETGFSRSEVCLDTASVWPCHRKKWWCLLTHPALNAIRVQPWSADGKFHAVAQLIDNFQVTPDDLCQLRLTDFEVEQFQVHKPLASYCLQVSGRLPTALHSWGSQVYSCPCGCRGPFTEVRLAKGISAVIVPFVDSEQGVAFRHLHPRELALLNGYLPGANFGPGLRLSLALLGQMASPLQSAWVLSQLKGHLQGHPDSTKLALLHLLQQRRQLVHQAAQAGMLSQQGAHRALVSLQESCLHSLAVCCLLTAMALIPSFRLPRAIQQLYQRECARVHCEVNKPHPNPCAAQPGFPHQAVTHTPTHALSQTVCYLLKAPVAWPRTLLTLRALWRSPALRRLMARGRQSALLPPTLTRVLHWLRAP